MNGLVLIDKPDGITSAEVVRRVKRRVRVKVGHLGTLDPFATGLLPLCLGEATKIAQFLNTADKQYTGVIQLGTATDTGDRTGTPVGTAPVPDLATVDLAELARRFTGAQLQTPPMYSALKRDGVPLYRLARRGVAVEREPRPVHIDRFTLEVAGPDRLAFSLACSKGTYVRVLAEEVGLALGTRAHLAELRRTAFGTFTLDGAVPLAAYDGTGELTPPLPGFVPLRAALAHLPTVLLDRTAAAAAARGQQWVLRNVRVPDPAAVLVDEEGEVAAVVVRDEHGWRYGRVLASAPLHPSPPVLVPRVK